MQNTRPYMLEYLAEALKLNAARGQMHFMENKLAREGYMLNLSVILQRLCVPVDQAVVRCGPLNPLTSALLTYLYLCRHSPGAG